MKNWKIGTRITVGFSAVIAVALAPGLRAYWSIQTQTLPGNAGADRG
jgi:hypothetical protein